MKSSLTGLGLGMGPTARSSCHLGTRQFSFIVILLLIVCGNQGSEISQREGGKAQIETLGNVTVLAGQTGQLKCKVTNPGNYTVSWLRHRDTHLLASGVDAYTADGRFRAFQSSGNTWGLRISNTRASDSGVYEPVTHIEGLNEKRSELFIKAGSTINLTCVVEDATENAPKHILWRHNSRMINFEWARGGMSLVTEKKTKGVTVSRLLIQKAVRTDSGVYHCEPQNAHPAFVKIHVLEQGEKQAAMQSGGFPLTSLRPIFLLPSLLFLIITFRELESFSSLTSSPSNQAGDPILFPLFKSNTSVRTKERSSSEMINLMSETSF